ncbi:hypothetical protein [Sinorhizobium americanum]|uniref:Metallo-beta-lactamase domain-containing protein n=1 Tax=Sinorhizobium americanum TaxID=194963 RepID=A0A4V2RE25_9HYPH|nr:hypothetical protein [Sinorhizobium americanum]TCN27050.1 hypothetical protein EV184_116124 [Sinorhizobium americanum]
MFVRVIGSAPGESLILLFDCGSAITIDCCKTGNENHTINSLEELGIGFEKVLFNVITHFHDDHIKGMSELAAACTNAKIVIPDAWTEDVFKYFVATVSDETTLGRVSVTKEIERIFDILKGSPRRLFTVSELSSLYPPPAHPSAKGESLIVLTPTVARKAKFLARLASAIAAGDTEAFGFCETNKNWTSICCILKYGEKYAFLGGDVENLSPDYDLSSVHQSHLKPLSRYEFVKLPHHGSDTSFCMELRSLINDDDTVVAITPYPRGHKPLPSFNTANYLRGAEKAYVLTGHKIGASRPQRMRRRQFVIDPIPAFRRKRGVMTAGCVRSGIG